MARLHLRVYPGARRTEFCGWFGEIPKMKVKAPPVGGAANEVLVAALAKAFGIRQRQVRLVGGAFSRTKRFEIEGLDDDQLGELVASLNPPRSTPA